MRLVLWIALIVLSFGGTAYADCVDPEGEEGVIVYNTNHKAMQFCDGSVWISMAGGGGSGGGGGGSSGGFLVTSTSLTIPTGGGQSSLPVNFATEVQDDFDAFDITTDQFTALESGWYNFHAMINWQTITTTSGVRLYHSFLGKICDSYDNGTGGNFYQNCSGNVYMSAGDTVEARVWHYEPGPANIEYAVFSGVKHGGSGDTLAGLTCASGEIAKWDGTAWACAADGGGGGGGGGGVSWEDVPLADTSNFDTACDYRAFVLGNVIYSDVVTPTFLFMRTNNGYITRIPSAEKGFIDLYAEGTDTLAQDNVDTVTSLQKNCGGGGGGSSVWADGGSGKIYYDGGNVGIGTTTPVGKLDVNASDGIGLRVTRNGAYNSEANNAIRVLDSGGGIGLHLGVDQAINAGYIQAMQPAVSWATRSLLLQANGGNVGIGTTAPSGKFHVNGSVYFQGLASASSGYYLCQDSGTNQITRGGSCSLSDERLKADIVTLTGSLENIGKLRGVAFDWKDKSRAADDGRQIGLIAQDVEKAFPEAVIRNDDGTLGLNYDALMGPVIEAIKELKAENDELTAKIEAQEEEIKALKTTHP